MNTIKKFIANYRVSLRVFWISLVTSIILLEVNKYLSNKDLYTKYFPMEFIEYPIAVFIPLTFLCFCYIFIRSTAQYTIWSFIVGALSIAVFIGVNGKVLLYLGIDDPISAHYIAHALIPIVYFIGALVAVLIKAIFSVFKKS